MLGGAGGYRTRVQKVTDYSSTDIVCLIILQPIELEDKQKYSIGCVEKCPYVHATAINTVSDIDITPPLVMSPNEK